jgi:hypothetical protein
MHIRKVALAACAALSTIALAGCGLPGLGGGTPDTPVSQPTVTAPAPATPDAATPAVPSPSASESASTPAAPVAGMKPMKRPTKSFPEPKYPKGPKASSSTATERLIYEFEKLVWKAAGTADAKATSGKCAVSNATLAKEGKHSFSCTITYNGVASPAKVTYTSGSFLSSYRYVFDSYPLTRTKAEYSAMYSAYDGVAVACDMKADTVSVQVGDEQGVLCHVQDSKGEVNDYYLEMSQYGSVYGNRA